MKGKGPQITFDPPFDRIMEGVPLHNHPDPILMAVALRRSRQQGIEAEEGFADTIIGLPGRQELQDNLRWDSSVHSLSLCTGIAERNVTPLEFAAATALHSEKCKILRLGPLESQLCLHNLELWTELRSLDCSAEMIPSNCPSSLENLKINLAKGDSVSSTASSTGLALPPQLQKLTVRGGDFQGLSNAVKEAKNLTWVDFADWENAPKEELLEVAREMMSREGVMLWPSGVTLRQITGACEKQERNELRAEAGRTAALVLRKARKDLQEVLLGTRSDMDLTSAIENLADAIRYGRNMKADPHEIEKAQGELFKGQGIKWAMMQPKSSVSNLTKSLGGGTKSNNRWKRASATIKVLGIKSQNSITIQDATRILVDMGLEHQETKDLLASADCEQKGYIDVQDVGELMKNCTPATIQEM
eukprot:gnl/MRDRNA2_/MRDRNA2_31839_c0_seq2.p1 gnl/MRDRNA2_/MRDRNA2_31839_c0~~gnl/MRDRNA2_/MRDRNA2_31839_c0_seq2.p1  ORF type:complete len:418 (-),score=86.14 gnl/MRDRNA2_/MRDRNA2_31839_c0_seq2:26-1279(-)